MSAISLEERLTELEVRFAFLEDAVTSLNTTVATHDRLLLDMREEFRRMRSELGVVRSSLSHDPSSEPPPPHY
ncbi:MAG TPA: SlyX family protein [Tahibacter sp.]|nr:SlyX family protein [Tahibacter sp.]